MSVRVCLVCNAAITDKRNVRLLASAVNIKPILEEFLCELSPPTFEDVFQRGLLCRSCLRNVEKLMKLRQELMRMEAEMKQWISGCLILVPQPPRSHGPIRFAGNDVSMNLIGPCDLAD